jgi:hypothetical protein
MATTGRWDLSWANQTSLHPFGLAAVILLGIGVLMLARHRAAMCVLIMACFVSSQQRIAVATLDFDLIRILVLFGWVRIFARRELTSIRWGALDFLIIVWAAVETIMYTNLWGSSAALINRLGATFDAIGLYFLFRCLIQDWEDLRQLCKGIAILSVPASAAFVVESLTRYNMFAVFGGVNEFTVIRDGRLRCQGPFSHPILAGTFWAAMMPLIGCLWSQGAQFRRLAVVGLACSTIIIVACASSTPVAAAGAGFVAALLWPARWWLGYVRVAVVALLVFLHFSMNKPVWHLIARIDIVGGSTGWHRYNLINAAIEHFDEWWITGTQSTAHWGWGLVDVTNQYVVEAVRGGLITLLLFVLMLVVAFRSVGPLWRANMGRPGRSEMAWALGASLFVHSIAFLSVSYFGQIIVSWYLSLALVGSLAYGTYGRTVEQPSAAGGQRAEQATAIRRGVGRVRTALSHEPAS